MDDVNCLKAWFANRFADGSRPPSVVVPEFTEKGFPHVHIILFGEGYVPHAVLSNYWDSRRDRESVVWCDAVVARGDRWLWAGECPDRADGRGPRAYFGKTLGDLDALAAAGRLRADDAEDDPAREWWKLACYWATETRVFTTSPSLRPDDGEASGRDAHGDADDPRWQLWASPGMATSRPTLREMRRWYAENDGVDRHPAYKPVHMRHQRNTNHEREYRLRRGERSRREAPRGVFLR